MANFNPHKVRSYDVTPDMIGQKILSFSIDWKEAQGLIDEGNKDWRKLKDFQRQGSLAISSYVANKARWLLDPDNAARNIGATGQASRNIFIRPIGKGEKAGYQIYEGVYRGNMFIRLGRRTGGDRPPARAIVEWIVHKKSVNIYPPESAKSIWRMTKKGGPNANLSSRAPRPWKRDLRQVAAIIGNKMKKTGMVHLKQFYPKGQPKYDYYGEIFKDRRKMKSIMLKRFSVWAKVYAKFLKTGQYRRVPDRVIEAGTEKL